jgi:hypothetical protein
MYLTSISILSSSYLSSGLFTSYYNLSFELIYHLSAYQLDYVSLIIHVMYYVLLYNEVCKTRNVCSKFAVVELVQLMDHRNISIAVDSTCLLRVAGRATSDFCHLSEFGT